MKSTLLTKSKYLAGLQCLKYLWIILHQPESVPPIDSSTQYLFDQGHTVGSLARELFPDGVDLSGLSFRDNIARTRELIELRKTILEAGICVDGLYSRVDILNPVGKGYWEIIEVKSGTAVKDINLHDVAFQKYCCTKAGLETVRCNLAYVNRDYVKNGPIDPGAFFKIENISDDVELAMENIDGRIYDMLELCNMERCPEPDIGKHCVTPYECAIKDLCWQFLPENNIFELRGGKVNQFSLYDRGIICIKDIPAEEKLSRQQQIQRNCVLTGNIHFDREAIADFLTGLEYPHYYLDFETCAPAVPVYDGMHPFQSIPFQFSLHVVDGEGACPRHFSYLAEGRDDPRGHVLAMLYQNLGTKGSIIAYNAGFEIGVLKDLVGCFPVYESWLEGICRRVVDLLAPFSNFHYYHMSQKDTASLKKVLPAVTGRSYENMGIGAGMEASILYERITYGDVPQGEADKVRADLLEYCKLDTEGMIDIVNRLKEMVKQ